MKRFGLIFGALVLALQLIGCGGSGGSSTATGSPADDSNLPSEVREYEARRSAERAARKTPSNPSKPAAR
jgi:hypothetical protein